MANVPNTINSSVNITDTVKVNLDSNEYEAHLLILEAQKERDEELEEVKEELPEIEESDFNFPTESEIKDSIVKVVDDNIRLPAVNYKLPLTKNILSEARMAKLLQWTEKETKLANRYTGILNQLPMVCAGTQGCRFGTICPIINRDDFIGQNCPLETLEVFKQFVGYARELGVTVNDHTDLMALSELCRNYLTIWRADMHLKTEEEVLQEAAIVSKDGSTTYYKKVINPYLDVRQRAEDNINKKLQELQATRAEKQKQLNIDKRFKDGNNNRTDSFGVLLSKLRAQTNVK